VDHPNDIIDRLPEGVIVLDAEGRCRYANARMHSTLGVEPGALEGRPWTDLVSERYAEPAGKADRSLRWGNAGSLRTRFVHVDGAEIPVKVGFQPRMRDGKFDGAVLVVTSISDLYQVEERLNKAVHLEGLGTLAGGIAHEFNNILTSILGYASVLKRAHEPSSIEREHVVRIERAAAQGAELTRQLLAFARQGKYQVQPIEIGELVRELTGLIVHSFPRNIDVRCSVEDGLPAVEADQGQIYQALLNLCINSREAMPGGGTLTLSVRRRVVKGDPGSSLMGGLPQGEYVHVEVADTGHGMDEATTERIFEPFFTTKGEQAASGLGLSTVYGIVQHHLGHIEVQSEKGRGTRFQIYLPSTDKPPRKAASTSSEHPAVGHETVLVVDDVEDIRRLVRTILTRLGYSVLEAGCGEEAVDVYSQKRDAIGCIVLDMVMPGMSGLETARKLREVDPEVRIILSSGFSIEEDAQEAIEEGIQGFLPKPYRAHTLAAELRRVLNE
jgi:PAS domain S-box-containing protein